MQRNLATFGIAIALGLGLGGGELHAESPSAATAEALIRDRARAIQKKDADAATAGFCRAWRRLERGMPFHEAEALGIEMNGSCTPGKPQSFHQPYMDLYFDAECRALHGATTLDC